jgi:hypothetical protein
MALSQRNNSVSFAMPENTAHKTARFIQNALAPGYPMGFWIGDAENPATFFSYMRYQEWHAASETMRSEGTRLLGCAAPMIGTVLGLAVAHTPAEAAPYHGYRIKVLPQPPSAAVILVAEGMVTQSECSQGIEAQRLFLDILFSEDTSQSL